VQQEMWTLTLQKGTNEKRIQDYLALTRKVNEFADPFLCSKCRFESLEYVWRCPQCFEWDTFSEQVPQRPPAGAPLPGPVHHP